MGGGECGFVRRVQILDEIRTRRRAKWWAFRRFLASWENKWSLLGFIVCEVLFFIFVVSEPVGYFYGVINVVVLSILTYFVFRLCVDEDAIYCEYLEYKIQRHKDLLNHNGRTQEQAEKLHYQIERYENLLKDVTPSVERPLLDTEST